MFEEQYTLAAKTLLKHVNRNAVTAIYSANFVEADVVQHIKYDYVNSDGSKSWFEIEDMDDFSDLNDAFRHIQTEMHKQTGNRWNKVTFTVHRDGKFDVDYAYD